MNNFSLSEGRKHHKAIVFMAKSGYDTNKKEKFETFVSNFSLIYLSHLFSGRTTGLTVFIINRIF